MRLLLDTHIILWAIVEDPRLPQRARELIEDEDNQIVVSAASIWEISVKYALGRKGPNAMPISGPQALAHIRKAEYDLLDVTGDHAVAVQDLPRLHADPFDRMIVAQAFVEPLRLITHDETVARYSSTIILV